MEQFINSSISRTKIASRFAKKAVACVLSITMLMLCCPFAFAAEKKRLHSAYAARP